MDINTNDIKKRIYYHFGNYDYKLFNSFIFSWESDFFAISKSGYSIEVEIKTSRSDFKADFKKQTRKGILKHDLIKSDVNNKPNKFYFACPEGLIKPDEINNKYGLIYIERIRYGSFLRVVRNAKFLHKEKILKYPYYLRKLLDKFYYRNIDLRQALNIAEYNIKYGQKTLNFNIY